MPVFDATTLLLFLEPDAPAPLDPATDDPVTDAKARIDHLIEALDKRRETIVIPTPALSEVLVHANEAGPEYLDILNTTRCFRIVPFDQRAAVELATMTREALREGDLRAGTQSTRAKLKFDRQIIAIARTLCNPQRPSGVRATDQNPRFDPGPLACPAPTLYPACLTAKRKMWENSPGARSGYP